MMQLLGLRLWPFFEWLLITTVQASLLVCLIIVVQTLLKRKLGVRWHYCLWLVLLIRMVLPWAPEFRFSLFTMLGSVFRRPVHDIAEVGSAAAAIGEQSLSGQPALDLITILPLIWLGGVFALGCYVLATNIRFCREIAGLPVLKDGQPLDILAQCKDRLRIRKNLRLVVTDHVESPALCGFFRPRLLLPSGMLDALSSDELRCVFLHELAHMRHLDILTSYLVSLLQILHWFNPVVWVAFYRMRADRELACDELVLSMADSDGPRNYGRTIISLVELFNRNRSRPAMVGIMETKSQLKRRIVMISQFRKLSRPWSSMTVVLVFIVAVVTLTNSTHSFTESDTIGRSQPPAIGSAQPLYYAVAAPSPEGGGDSSGSKPGPSGFAMGSYALQDAEPRGGMGFAGRAMAGAVEGEDVETDRLKSRAVRYGGPATRGAMGASPSRSGTGGLGGGFMLGGTAPKPDEESADSGEDSPDSTSENKLPAMMGGG